MALKTEGFQPGDLVTLVDKAISLCELRTLYPQGLAPLTPSSPVKTHLSPWIHASRTSTDGSSSDLDLSCTPPANSFMTPPSSPRKRHLMKSSDKQHNKKMSTDSTHTLIQGESAFTVGRGLQHSSSLSQMKMGVNDFLRALRGFVPVALRGLPLHRSGTIDFSGVGGLKTVKKCLKETLLWPSKVCLFVCTVHGSVMCIFTVDSRCEEFNFNCNIYIHKYLYTLYYAPAKSSPHSLSTHDCLASAPSSSGVECFSTGLQERARPFWLGQWLRSSTSTL